ncbi:MAG: inositol monophosphatase [Firmicutes bacterium]|nr:inositol monophosphatase [Bacillota bacterium]
MLLEVAKDIAYGAGRILREKINDRFSIEHKGDIDLVTDADQASEELIVKAIENYFPNHAILAEEEGKLGKSESDFLWVIDPLDGTTNFAHRFPYFAVSIAILEKGERVIGVVYNPMSDEMYAAERGCGAWLNDERISVSKIDNLKQSLLATGFSYNIATQANDNVDNYRAFVKATQGVLRLGSASLDLCQVACGRLDGFWEFSLKSWDIAAASLILEEAGGKVTDLKGGVFDPFKGEIIGSNRLLHDQMIKNMVNNNTKD